MNEKNPLRWQQRFDNFELSLKQLESACSQTSYTDLEFAGFIKNFEISFEMAWKTLKDLLSFEGYDVNSPRATIQQAYHSGYITDPAPWVSTLESRNILSHTYDKTQAADSEVIIKRTYLPMLQEVYEKLESKNSQV